VTPARGAVAWALAAAAILASAGDVQAQVLAQAQARAQAQPGPGVAQCAAAYEEAQRLQASARLLEARGEAAACAAIACPPEIVRYCAQLADEIEASVPSIVIAAVDAAGRDLAATVSIDDATAKPLDGRPIRLNPGAHRLRVSTTAAPVRSTSVEVALRSGERNRRVEVVLGGGAAPVAGGGDPARAPLGWAPAVVAFGVATVGLGVGVTTGVIALSEDADLEEACNAERGTCPEARADQVASTERLGYASTIGFAVGGAALVAGVVLAIVAGGGAGSGAGAGAEVGAHGVRVRF
jgi:hypothetical protein